MSVLSKDERIVSIKMDYSSVQNGATKVKSLLSGVTDGIKKLGGTKISGMAEGVRAIGAAASTTANDVLGLGNSTDTVSTKFNALKAVATGALLNIGATISSKLLGALNSFTIAPVTEGFNEYELKMKSVTTIMTNTGESIENVNKVLDDLNKYSDLTIYSFSDMTAAMGAMGASGLSLQESADSIKGFFNAAAGVGIDSARATGLLNTALNQSISLGYLNYENWKQLSQAGFGNKFKNTLIETAKEMGKNVDSTKDFNSSLKEGWASTDVLIAALRKMKDDKALLSAATEARTFTQAMDTAKEAIVSGWAQSWEILVGGYTQASERFTALANKLGTVISAMNKQRNDFLQGFVDSGGVKAIIDTISNIWTLFGNVIKSINDAWKSVGVLGQGFSKLPALIAVPFKMVEWFTRKLSESKMIPFVIGTAFKVMFAIVSPIMKLLIKGSELFMKGWNKAIDTINKFKEAIKSLKIEDNLINPIKAMSTSIKKGIVESLKSIVEAFQGLKKSIASIFKGDGFGDLVDWAKNLKDKIVDALSFKNVRNAFGDGKMFKGLTDGVQNLFSSFLKTGPMTNAIKVFDTMKTSIKSFVETVTRINFDGFVNSIKELAIVKDIQSAFSGFGTSVSKLWGAFNENKIRPAMAFFGTLPTIKFGDIVTGMNNLYNATKQFFDGLDFSPITNRLVSVYDAVKTFVTSITSWLGRVIVLPGLESIQNGVQKVINWLGKMDSNTIGNGFDNIKDKVSSWGTTLKNVFIDVANFLQIKGQSIGEVVKNMGVKIGEGLRFSVQAISDFFEGLSKGYENAKGVVANISTLASSFAKKIKATFGDALSTENLMKGGFIIYLGVILKSFHSLSKKSGGLIDAFKGIVDSVANIPEALSTIAGAIADFGKQAKPSEILKIGISIGILAVSIKLLSTIPGEEVAKTLGLVGAAVVSIVAPLIVISKLDTKGIVKGVTTMIAVSAAILLMSFAMKNLASIDGDDMKKALGATAALLTGLVLTMAGLTKATGGKLDIAIRGMIGLAASLVVLALAVKLFGEMDFDTLKQGMGAVAVGLTIMAVAIKIISNSKFSLGAGLALISLAKSLSVLGDAVKLFGEMDFDTLKQGMGSVAVGLTIMAVALRSIDGVKSLGAATSVILLAVALKMLVGPVKELGEMDYDTLKQGLGSSAILIGGITVALKALSSNAGGSMAGAAAILLVSVALTSLIAPITILGTMKWETLVQGIGALAVALAAVVVAGYLATGAAPGLFAIAAAVGAVALGAAAIAIAVTGLVALMEWLTSSSKATFDQLLTNIEDFMARIQESIPKFVEFALAIIDGFLQTITGAWPKILDTIGSLILTLLDKIQEYLPQFLQKAYDIIIGILNVMNEKIPEVVNVVTNLVVNFLNALSNNLPRIVDAAMNFILTFINALASAVETYGPQINAALMRLIKAMISTIIGFGGQLLNSGIEILGKFVDGAKSGASNLWSTISGFFTSIPGKISGAVGDLYQSGRSILSRFVDGISSKIEDAKSAVSGGLSKIRSLFPFSPAKEGPFSGKGWVLYSGMSILPAFAEGLAKTTNTAVNQTSKSMNKIKTAFNNEASGLTDTFTFKPATLSDMSFKTSKAYVSTLYENSKLEGSATFESKVVDKLNEFVTTVKSDVADAINNMSDRAIVVEQHIDKKATAAVLAEPITNQTKKDELIRKMVEGRG